MKMASSRPCTLEQQHGDDPFLRVSHDVGRKIVDAQGGHRPHEQRCDAPARHMSRSKRNVNFVLGAVRSAVGRRSGRSPDRRKTEEVAGRYQSKDPLVSLRF
jgi:hypothetical protein